MTRRRYDDRTPNITTKRWFDVDPNGEVWCQHRDISCCPKCFARDHRFVDVGGVVYLVTDPAELAELAAAAERGDRFVSMSPAYANPDHPTHPKAKEPPMSTIETHEQFRGALLNPDFWKNKGEQPMVAHDTPDETLSALVRFARAKKIRVPQRAEAPAEPQPKARKTRNAGAACKVEGCDRPASSLGMCKKHHTAHWRKSDPKHAEATRHAARKHAAKKRYVQLVQAIGDGFHPDTPGGSYSSLPEGITAERVDKVIDDALGFQLDVYALALDALGKRSA